MYSLMKSRMLKALRRSSMGFYINRMLMSMLQAAPRGSFRRILSPSSEAGEMKLGQDLSHSGRLLITRDRIKQDTQSQFQGLKQSEITLKKFMSLLINDGGRNRSVTYYAEQLFISPKYLSSLMKKSTGRTALDIIREVTVKNIKQDLLYSEKSIKEIANEYDFPNISFFGKFFKQQMGISPRQYRNQNKKQISTDTNPKLDL